MADTADSDGKVTRLDVEDLDRWFERVGHVARGIDRQLAKLSKEAPGMTGKDARFYRATRLRDQHEGALSEAHLAVRDISGALAKLQEAGRKVADLHGEVDGRAADNVRGSY